MKNKSTLKRLMAFCRPYRIYLVGASPNKPVAFSA